MGRKPLNPEERRVSVTIRLDPKTLELIDETLKRSKATKGFLGEIMANHYSIPKNRSELISWILKNNLYDASLAFSYLSWLPHTDETELANSTPTIKKVVDNNVLYKSMADSIIGIKNYNRKMFEANKKTVKQEKEMLSLFDDSSQYLSWKTGLKLLMHEEREKYVKLGIPFEDIEKHKFIEQCLNDPTWRGMAICAGESGDHSKGDEKTQNDQIA